MTLTPGMHLGPHQISAQIGEGGMGEVYRATDTKLKRQVAIKVLPASVAGDRKRLARFQREAEVLAALNHPHIAQVYGFEDGTDTKALVMELVEGPTLADRIAQGRIPIDEALPIATQIAEALEAAHEQGIVHRDLKPANIKVREDGTVKVLDFGLAKALSSEGANAAVDASPPTLTSPSMTRMGMILGTAGYMAPEQARGKPVDRRADIWAFGCVLYEMLTGSRAFEGEDVSLTLSAVLQREPDWTALPPVPPALMTYLRRCLEKDPRQRVQAVGDVRLALEGAFDGVPAAATAAGSARRHALQAGAALLAGGLVVGLAAWMLWPTLEPASPARFLYELPDGQTFRQPEWPIMALSRDGRSFVYNTPEGLYLRTMDAEQARLIPGTELNLRSPFFSPDGQSVGFFDVAAGALKRIGVAGGTPALIAPSASPSGVSWESDGTILYGQPEGILRVPATGGTPKVVIKAEAGEGLYSSQLLPDGDSVLLVAVTGGFWPSGKIVSASLSTGERTVLVDQGSDPRYVAPGYLTYAVGDELFARGFAPDRRSVSGDPVPVVQGVMRANGIFSNGANYGVSGNGTLVYVNAEAAPKLVPVWVDRQHREEPLSVPPGFYGCPRLSPDRTRLSLTTMDGDFDVFVWDLARHVLTNVTASKAYELCGVWSPDSRRLIFSSSRGGPIRAFWQSADGTGTAERLPDSGPATENHYAEGVSPDGAWVIFMESGGTHGLDQGLLSLTGDHESRDLLASNFNENDAEVSPNGRWVAYWSDRGGGYPKIYVSPFPDAAARRWQVSSGGGLHPAWAPDGRTLFYVDARRRLMSVAVDTGQEDFVYEPPRELLDVSGYSFDFPGRPYDLDDKRFLFFKNVDQRSDADARRRIHIVQHWAEELETRIANE